MCRNRTTRPSANAVQNPRSGAEALRPGPVADGVRTATTRYLYPFGPGREQRLMERSAPATEHVESSS